MKHSSQNNLKLKVACEALNYIDGHTIIGVGTGSTVNYFIDELAKIKHRIDGCVASSKDTAQRLKNHNIPVFALTTVGSLALYIDGADEVTVDRAMIKGGGGALTCEKILATSAKEFICIVDESKWVSHLGQFPVAVEVLPIARSLVGRELLKLGGQPVYREGSVTDSGNIIIDVHGLDLTYLSHMENLIKQIPGVVENGIFAKRLADRVLVAKENEIVSIT